MDRPIYQHAPARYQREMTQWVKGKIAAKDYDGLTGKDFTRLTKADLGMILEDVSGDRWGADFANATANTKSVLIGLILMCLAGESVVPAEYRGKR